MSTNHNFKKYLLASFALLVAFAASLYTDWLVILEAPVSSSEAIFLLHSQEGYAFHPHYFGYVPFFISQSLSMLSFASEEILLRYFGLGLVVVLPLLLLVMLRSFFPYDSFSLFLLSASFCLGLVFLHLQAIFSSLLLFSGLLTLALILWGKLFLFRHRSCSMSLYAAGYVVFFACLNTSLTSLAFTCFLWFFLLFTSLGNLKKPQLYYLLSLPIPGLVAIASYIFHYGEDVLGYYAQLNSGFFLSYKDFPLFEILQQAFSNLGILGVIAPFFALVYLVFKTQDPLSNFLLLTSFSLLSLDLFFLRFHWQDLGIQGLNFVSLLLVLLVTIRWLNWRRKSRFGVFAIWTSLFLSYLLLGSFYLISLSSQKIAGSSSLFFWKNYPHKQLGLETSLSSLLDRDSLPIVVVDSKQVYPSYYFLRKLGLVSDSGDLSLISLKPSPEARLWHMFQSLQSQSRPAKNSLESLPSFYLLDTHLLDWYLQGFAPRAYQSIASHSCSILNSTNNKPRKTQHLVHKPLIYLCQKIDAAEINEP